MNNKNIPKTPEKRMIFFQGFISYQQAHQIGMAGFEPTIA
ncbi:hypothetical protein CUZ96_2660 [Enterococcus lactis]|nr:hypothetical protein [Enterococcus lactis]MBL5012992.1 hypothetical protein [Enterococcus lactis]